MRDGENSDRSVEVAPVSQINRAMEMPLRALHQAGTPVMRQGDRISNMRSIASAAVFAIIRRFSYQPKR